MYNKGLFANWVPKLVQLLLIFGFLLPVIVISGIYTGNLNYMTSGLGTYNEWLVFANYAGIVGMGTSLPIIFRLKLRYHVKIIMVTTFFMLAILSFIIGTTDNNFVIVACSFLIGFFKMLAMIEVILPVMYIISPDGNRQRFYAIFYPLAITIPQIAGYFLTRVGFFSFWENANFIMALVMLLCTLLSVIFMHHQRFDRKVPLYYVDWMGMFLYTIVFLAMAYFLAFAKQQNYFRSDSIMVATAIVIVGIIFYQIHQHFTKRPFVDFRVLKKYNVIHGIMMLFMLGFFLAGSSLQSKITRGALGFSTVLDNSYNLWMIPGIVIGSIFSLKWSTKDKSLKTYNLIGFSAFLFYYIFMYFLVSPDLSYQHLIVPNIIRGFAMAVLFIGVWIYALSNLSMDATLGVAAVLIITRTMIGPGVWSVFLNYVDGFWKLEALNNLAGKVDAAAYSKQMAMSMYKNLNINAMLISIKRLYGFLVLIGGTVLIYTSFLHFEGIGKRSIIILRKRLKREDTKGYAINAEGSDELKTEIEAASAAAI